MQRTAWIYLQKFLPTFEWLTICDEMNWSSFPELSRKFHRTKPENAMNSFNVKCTWKSSTNFNLNFEMSFEFIEKFNEIEQSHFE